MGLTAAERQKLSRDRRRRRVTPVTVEVHDKEVEFLAERGYGARLDDPVSISQTSHDTRNGGRHGVTNASRR